MKRFIYLITACSLFVLAGVIAFTYFFLHKDDYVINLQASDVGKITYFVCEGTHNHRSITITSKTTINDVLKCYNGLRFRKISQEYVGVGTYPNLTFFDNKGKVILTVETLGTDQMNRNPLGKGIPAEEERNYQIDSSQRDKYFQAALFVNLWFADKRHDVKAS